MMAFRLFAQPAAAVAEASDPVLPAMAAPPIAPAPDPARDILELLELDLGGLVRQLEKAAGAVAGGAQSTAATLKAIRARSDALAAHSTDAQHTASTFAHAADEFTQSAQAIGAQVRDAGRLADEAGAAAQEASANVDRLRQSSAAIGEVLELIAQIARQTTMLALNATIEAARAGTAGRGFAVVATEVKALAVQTQGATAEIKRKIDALQHDAANSVAAVHRISSAIAAIRPVFAHVNDAVAEQNVTTHEMAQNAASASQFIAAVGDSAGEIDSAAIDAAQHGEHVAEAGAAVTRFAAKLKARCAVLMRQDDRDDGDRRDERLPCHLAVTLTLYGTPLEAPAYEISMAGLLIGGPDAARLPREAIIAAELRDIGPCRLRISGQMPGGAQAMFVAPEPDFISRVEDRLWAIHDENTEGVTRALEAGTALNKIFADGIAAGAITLEDMFDDDYVAIEGSNPVQYRTKILPWADRALPAFQDAFLARDKRMAFCAMIDRNGYLPVHNTIYSQPQRPGDVAWNTAHCRNRRIFNDAAGLAAGQNTRAYLVQTYARDMGNGVTVMMREIDVPVRVQGRHWGGFRTAYKL